MDPTSTPIPEVNKEEIKETEPIPNFYLSKDCVRFHTTEIFLYKSKYLYTGTRFYKLNELISMYIDKEDEYRLVIVYDDGLSVTSVRLQMIEEKSDYTTYDLYVWLYEVLVNKKAPK